jgi:Zn-dependent protease with chaperone function
MSNPFYYLAGLLLATAYPLGIEPLAFVRRMITPWAVLGSLLVYAGICWAVLARPLSRSPLARFVLRILALVLYAELLFVFHLPLWIWKLGVEDDPLISSLLTLAPLIAFYGILAVIHARTEPRSGGVRFAFRGFVGLSFLPILLMLLLDELFERVESLRRVAFIYPSVGWMLALGSLSLLMVFLPPLLRMILGARPLEKGPLRERLERMCGTAGFHASELLVVPTGTSRMANAFVVGLSARWRYVFFTEAILDGMSPEELECVLVHEVTHSQKRHIVFYLIAALAFSLLSGLAHEALDALGVPSVVLLSGMLGWALFYWGVAFGYVSRRFETEADLVAARVAPAVEGGFLPYAAARRMAAALERVAALNHVPVWAPSWRHFTIEKRIDILLHAEINPSTGARFELVCDRLRRLAAVLLLGGLLCGGVLLGLQHGRAPENRALLAAHESVDRGRQALERKAYAEAVGDLRRGIEGGSNSGAALLWLAEGERALGREEEAREAEAKARKKGVTDPRLRLRLRLGE